MKNVNLKKSPRKGRKGLLINRILSWFVLAPSLSVTPRHCFFLLNPFVLWKFGCQVLTRSLRRLENCISQLQTWDWHESLWSLSPKTIFYNKWRYILVYINNKNDPRHQSSFTDITRTRLTEEVFYNCNHFHRWIFSRNKLIFQLGYLRILMFSQAIIKR